MNLNKEQFKKAVMHGLALCAELEKDYPELRLSPVFSRFGPRSGQCGLTTDLRKIVMEFPLMLSDEMMASERAQEVAKKLRQLLADMNKGKPVGKEVNEVERKLLAPELKLYCGDVNIEFRCGVLKYESLRRLQQDPRLANLGVEFSKGRSNQRIAPADTVDLGEFPPNPVFRRLDQRNIFLDDLPVFDGDDPYRARAVMVGGRGFKINGGKVHSQLLYMVSERTVSAGHGQRVSDQNIFQKIEQPSRLFEQAGRVLYFRGRKDSERTLYVRPVMRHCPHE